MNISYVLDWIGAGMILLVFAWLLFVKMDSYIRKKKDKVEVPNVLSMHICDAMKKIHENDLSIEVNEHLFHEDVEKRCVIIQNPCEGTIVKKYDTVYVFLSKGKPKE